jgi:hypothetical protein
MHRAQSRARRKHSRHAITDVGDWDLEELLREFEAYSLMTLQDLKTEHDDPSGLKVEFDFCEKVLHESGFIVDTAVHFSSRQHQRLKSIISEFGRGSRTVDGRVELGVHGVKDFGWH